MRLRAITVALACLAFPVLVAAQGTQLELPSFSHLQQQATEVVDITIGSWPLWIASALADADDSQSAEMKSVIKGLKRVVVRSYRFDSDFAYSKADIAAVRAQLTAPGWTQVAQVRDRKQNEDVDIYVAFDHDKVTGFAIIACEPREFTILNIVGSLDVEQVAKVQKHLNLPGIGVERVSELAP